MRDGADPDAQVAVDFTSPEAFSDFSHELLTAAGVHVTNGVHYRTGGYVELTAREPALRVLYHGRPPAPVAHRNGSSDTWLDDPSQASFP